MEPTSELAATIGANLRAAREAAGLNQREAGRRAGICHNRLSEWECGKHLISLPFLLKLADVYDASVLTILGAGQPSAFRFDDDGAAHDPTGEWIDEDADGWTLDGWLYPADGGRPVPLMQLTRSGDETIRGPLAYLSDLISDGARREKEG